MTPKLISRIKSALRKCWYYSANRRLCKSKAKRGKLYLCELCNSLVAIIQIDHKIAVGSIDDW